MQIKLQIINIYLDIFQRRSRALITVYHYYLDQRRKVRTKQTSMGRFNNCYRLN